MGDVAAAVGVSKTTISRYLHGEFDCMSEETRARIEQVIADLDYRPNKIAQGLKATYSRMIGVTVADIGNPFSSMLLKGIHQECHARDIQLLVSESNNAIDLERSNIESLLDAQVDGLIVNTVGNNDAWLADYCAKEGSRPVVMLDRAIDPIVCDCVVTDNRHATFTMLDYLAEQGFAYVAYVSPPMRGISTRRIRRDAVLSYMQDRPMRGEILEFEYGQPAQLAASLKALIDRHGKERLCLFANNESTMSAVVQALPHAACCGPERLPVGICSFASEEWAKCTRSGITCLDQRPVVMGREAAGMLLARTYDGYTGEATVKEIPATLCVYPSTSF
ncbi:MAG: LacI family DNA-binding transcriptional regulator [Actinomycetaceae bacterium]|nr:LacI family DNA-binding transcriptional regulator [Actinomycetaceae bacterium]MDU0970885.1 LacI family DNA-binding transcriptional regulator [Actinomycetaceae bacterium]